MITLHFKYLTDFQICRFRKNRGAKKENIEESFVIVTDKGAKSKFRKDKKENLTSRRKSFPLDASFSSFRHISQGYVQYGEADSEADAGNWAWKMYAGNKDLKTHKLH